MKVAKAVYNESAKDLKSYDSKRVMTIVKASEKVSTLRYKSGNVVSHVNVSNDKFDIVAHHRGVVGEECFSANSKKALAIEDVDVTGDKNLIKIAGVWCRAENYTFMEDGANVNSEINGVMG